jgi:hypothetical protein
VCEKTTAVTKRQEHTAQYDKEHTAQYTATIRTKADFPSRPTALKTNELY